ncbi:unnamed protein product, partial [Ectocarpus fasciculatus]
MGQDGGANPDLKGKQQQPLNVNINTLNSSPDPPDQPSSSTTEDNTNAGTNQGFLRIDGTDSIAASTLSSCEQLKAGRTPLNGVVVVKDHVICQEARTIEVSKNAYIVSR